MIKESTFIRSLFLFTLLIVFSQCKSTSETMKIDNIIKLEETNATHTYFQTWVAGVQGGGSGLNLVLSKSFLKDLVPIQVYFRNKIASAKEKQFDFTAYYKGERNQLKDTLSEDKDPIIESSKTFPFDLKENEAIISYLNDGEITYLKITNIPQKESLAYPSTRPQN